MDVDHSVEEGSSGSGTILSDLPSSSSLQLQEVTVPCSSEEEMEENEDSSSSSDDGEEEEEEEEEDDDMRTQVKEFFAELKVEERKQKKSMMKEGVRIAP